MTRTTKQIAIFTIMIGLFRCGLNADLSTNELAILKEIGFDIETAKMAKRYFKGPFFQFETSDPGYIINNGKQQKTGIKKQNGISWKVDNRITDKMIFGLENDLKTKGYLIFLSEMGYQNNPSEITVIKSTDQFNILDLQKTDGINYDIENKDVIQKLRDWNKKYGIEIIGADSDWVEILIKSKPQDVKSFAAEVYEFCPDSVDQGVESIKALEAEISNKLRLFLWWD